MAAVAIDARYSEYDGNNMPVDADDQMSVKTLGNFAQANRLAANISKRVQHLVLGREITRNYPKMHASVIACKDDMSALLTLDLMIRKVFSDIWRNWARMDDKTPFMS